MIEFTLSRVVLCICCAAILCACLTIMDDAEDETISELDSAAVSRIASMLDRFSSSVADELTLDGEDVLPREGYRLTVSDHVVSLSPNDSDTLRTYTSYEGSFTLSWGSSVTLRKSVPEGLGDLADGVGENVHLLEGVVDVRGCAGASLYPSGNVERVRTVHSRAYHHT